MDDELRSLTEERAYAMLRRLLDDGCLGVELTPRRDGEHYDVNAKYSQGPYEVDRFVRIQAVADEFGLRAYFNVHQYCVKVAFR